MHPIPRPRKAWLGKVNSNEVYLFSSTNESRAREVGRLADDKQYLACSIANSDLSGPKKLIITTFFFWRPGSDLQKSIQGLCRSLLYDLLKERPDLIPETMCVDWEQAARSTWHTEAKMNISADSIRAALKRLVRNKRLYEDHRHCFFIDGLDEHEDTHHSDYHDLVKLLRRFSDAADGDLKLCLSSREENVFMAAYSGTPSLRLHELTQFDMRKYVLDRLEHVQNYELKSRLATIIPAKADGIFFWTSLAVQMVRDKLADGESGEDVEAHLDSLPSGLRALFEHILDRLDDANKSKTYRLVALMEFQKQSSQKLFGPDPGLSLLAFSFLDEYDKDKQFSTREDYAASPSVKNRSKMIASQKLRGACGGLIVHHDRMGRGWRWGLLEYAHRSVPELFEAESIKRRMEASLNGFDAMDAKCHLIFAEVQSLPGTEEPCLLWSLLIKLRLRYGIDQPPYTLLEPMVSWIDDAHSQHPGPGFDVRDELGREMGWTMGTSQVNPDSWCSFYRRYHCFSALCIAAKCGRPGIEYIKWKLQNDPTATGNPFKQAVVAHSILTFQGDMQILDSLFEGGFFTEDVPVDFLSSCSPNYSEFEWSHGDPLTIWQRYQSEICQHIAGTKFFESSPNGDIIERFLRLEVDPSMTIIVETGEEEEEEEEGYEIWEFQFKKARVTMELKSPTKLMRQMSGLGERDGNRAVYSFRDLIQASELENKDRLLALLDSKQYENHDFDGKTAVDDVEESGGDRGEEEGSRIGSEAQDRIECEDQHLVEAGAKADQLGENNLARASRASKTPNVVPVILFGKCAHPGLAVFTC